MASIDPRLADMTVLVLAAKRCQAARQAPDWRQTEGLASLLAIARRQGRQALPEDLEDDSGLAGLLREARARAREEHRPCRDFGSF